MIQTLSKDLETRSGIESHGPKLVENITQAVSRDILAHAMKTL